MITRILRGKKSLAISFWLFGAILSPIFFWLTLQLGKFLPCTWNMTVVFGVWFLYGAFVSILIWVSSAKYEGPKIWVYLSRISMCLVWLISLVIVVFISYFMPLDLFTNSYTIKKQIELDPSLPYIGFWKSNCSDNFGLAIEKAATDEYYVRFCGPGGCFGKTDFTRTKLIGDPKYKIIDNDTIGMSFSLPQKRALKPEEERIFKDRVKDGLLIYKRCK